MSVTSCTTSPTTGQKVPDIARIALVVRGATELGVKVELAKQPASMAAFRIALTQLSALATATNIGPNDILNIISRLPIKQLNGQNGTLIFDGAKLIIIATGWSNVDADRLKQLQPIVVALRDGLIDAGVTP